MSKIIVTAVGVSGSGKSNAYGAIMELLKVRRRDSYYLTACGATPEERIRNSGIINRYADINQGFVSTGTMITTEFPFAFGGHFRPDVPTYPLLDMPLIDYPGGVLKTMLGKGSEESSRLLHRIMDTDVLLLFADANILSEEGGVEPARQKIALEINTIFEILSTERDTAFVSKPRTVLLLLTKCDSGLIPQELKDNHFHGLVNRALQVFDPTVRFCINQPGWKIAVVPTSTCGDGNSNSWRDEGGIYHSEMTAPPQPYGFDLAILYGVMNELENRVRLGYDDSEEIPEQVERKPGFVSGFQWRHILQRLAGQENEQISLYRQYAGNLHSILDPLCGSQIIEV
ncbi:hypothetical protein [Butyricicoccus porcorum]|uniref:Uncharacterized protein n=1 Tax=Butyricicoccus porcorum TaxID=1945634 RepID=A0A252F7W0_9FIRM|nr:hypothetical protein [Butyricicoccus porcorum]MCI6926398.1 hypothetical protein [Butyricicoccus porcorum]OUM21868.1 hypothetical protein CBW42_01210 [Butyricicoccus porcorum]